MSNCCLYLSGSFRSSVGTWRTDRRRSRSCHRYQGWGLNPIVRRCAGGSPHEAKKEAWELLPAKTFPGQSNIPSANSLNIKHASQFDECSITVNPENHAKTHRGFVLAQTA